MEAGLLAPALRVCDHCIIFEQGSLEIHNARQSIETTLDDGQHKPTFQLTFCILCVRFLGYQHN